jgi:O-antigen/teichoic acid export membrane protein
MYGESTIHAGKLFLKNTSFIYFKSAVSQAVNIIIIVAVIKELPVNDFGIYNFLTGSVPLLQVLTTGGILTLFQRYLPEYISKESYPLAKQLIYKSFSLATPLLILLMVIYYLSGDSLSAVFNIENLKFYLSVFAVYAFLYLCNGMVSQILATLLMQKLYSINFSVYSLIRGGLFLYILLAEKLSLMSLLKVETISYGILFVLNIALLYGNFWEKHKEQRRCFKRDESRRLIRYVLFSSFNEFGSTVLNIQTDYYIISFFLGPIQLGFYAFANRIRMILESALPMVKGYEVLRSLFFSELQDSDEDKINRSFNFLLKLSLFVVLPMVIFTAILGKSIIQYIFSSEYATAYPVLVILAIYIIGTSVFFILNLIVQFKEKVEILLYSKVFAFYNLVVSMIVVKFWGIEGVALASLSALVFQNIYIFYHLNKFVTLKADLLPIVKIFINASATGIIVFFLNRYIHSLYSLISVTMAGTVVFFVLSFLNKAFQPKERDMINSAAGFRVWSF